MNEIKELVGMAESRDPTDRDRFHLKTIIRNLKQRNDTLTDENKQMGVVIDQVKSGRFNETEAARLVMSEQQITMQEDLTTLKTELE